MDLETLIATARVAALLLLAAPLSFAAESNQTIKTTDGYVYTNATIIDLSPTGIVISIENGIANIPYSKLPQNLQKQYGYNAEELRRFLKRGLDGQYGPREGALAGEIIELKKNQFTYQTFSDVFAPGVQHPILGGEFTTVGNWLVLNNPKITFTNRVMAIVDGRLALLTPVKYWLWKDSGRLDRHDALFQRRPR